MESKSHLFPLGKVEPKVSWGKAGVVEKAIPFLVECVFGPTRFTDPAGQVSELWIGSRVSWRVRLARRVRSVVRELGYKSPLGARGMWEKQRTQRWSGHSQAQWPCLPSL